MQSSYLILVFYLVMNVWIQFYIYSNNKTLRLLIQLIFHTKVKHIYNDCHVPPCPCPFFLEKLSCSMSVQCLCPNPCPCFMVNNLLNIRLCGVVYILVALCRIYYYFDPCVGQL